MRALFTLDQPCPACGEHLSAPFFDGGDQPLATLAWPASAREAQEMERLPLRFVRCLSCGHVYNEAFEADRVPYVDKPNLMFNRGVRWQEHLQHVREVILEALPPRPVVAEIGCGDGHLLRSLAQLRPEGRYLGFDLNGQITHAGGAVEAHPIRFEPHIHVAETRPDLIVARHLLEHLVNPLGFLQQLEFAASQAGLQPHLFIEVPCIDRVFESGRTEDFYYEHNSHFTRASFTSLLSRATASVERVEVGYGGEVIYGLARLGGAGERLALANRARAFHARAEADAASLRQAFDALGGGPLPVVIWGGTGKAAAFIHRYHLDAARFPWVVDSDPEKHGTYVPGSGQRIESPDGLRGQAVVVVIATQWRAGDIALEIAARGLHPAQLLLVHDGRLVDFWKDPHPYR